MQTEMKNVKYPQNLYLRFEVFKDPRTIQELADAIGVSRKVVSDTINGKYLGGNIVPMLRKELGLEA